jgi:4-amino-4-deoxy-L-arabinose transferase-like glycosyltransferase
MSSATAAAERDSRQPAAAPTPARERDELAWGLALAAVIALAAVLRLYAVAKVGSNPFYDAAVRSMTLSWHNFFFGAFDPGASAAIDKPPADLWLQVAAVKLFGFGPTALRLPAALGATLGVGLLYDVVRRFAGRPAALASALALALMPVSVLTSRSDTMDSLMMGLLVAAVWMAVRSLQTRRLLWLLGAAALLGLDFNVKLFEALVPVPAVAVGLWLAWRGDPLRARLLRLGLAGTVFAVTALAWLVAVSLAAAPDRPYPIGSSNGSVWNAVFVYNGSDRLLKAPRPSRFAGNTTGAAAAAPAPGAPARPHISPHHHNRPTSRAPAGPLRLFSRSKVDFGGLVGTMLFAALVFGAIALLRSWRALLRLGPAPSEAATLRRAGVVALALWLLTGFVLFSAAGRVHPRYLEAFSPAVAATLGIGIVALAVRARSRAGAVELAAALAAVAVETLLVTRLKGAVGVALALGVVAAAATAAVVLLAARVERLLPYWPRWWLTAAATLGSLAAVLALPAGRDLQLIRNSSGDAAASPQLRSSLVVALSRYLRAHQDGARYEVAASAPSLVAQLIVHDARPVTLLTTYEARPLVGLAALQARIRAGDVRYVLASGRCPVPPYRLLPQCSAAVTWVRAHGRDVTAELHMPITQGLLYSFTPAAARQP